MDIFTKEELLQRGYVEDSYYLVKNTSRIEIENKVKEYYENIDSSLTRNEQYEKLMKPLDAFRSFKEGFAHISFFNPEQYQKGKIKSGPFYYKIRSQTRASDETNDKNRQAKNLKNNFLILRKYHSGNENEELKFGSINMERRKVTLLNEDTYVADYELHHISLINNQSRDKEDIDPCKWLRGVDITSYDTKPVIHYDLKDKKLNHKDQNFDNIVFDIKNGSLLSHHKNENSIKRVKELLCCMIIPKSEHGALHSCIASKSRNERNVGFSSYNKKILPHALKNKVNYDNFISWLCVEFKFNPIIFSSYEDHIEFLEV